MVNLAQNSQNELGLRMRLTSEDCLHCQKIHANRQEGHSGREAKQLIDNISVQGTVSMASLIGFRTMSTYDGTAGVTSESLVGGLAAASA
jgi:hypothetical protein